MKKYFACFANDGLYYERDSLCESARAVGFDQVVSWSEKDLVSDQFFSENKKIFEQARGFGYWLWKPYLILRFVENLNPGDVLFYSDSGRKKYCSYNLEKFPSKLLDQALLSDKGFLLGPALYQHGSLSKWTKRDCFVLMDAEDLGVVNRPAIQAGWSIWTKCDSSLDFLRNWLQYCCDERCLTDLDNQLGLPNYPDFVDHRHDQSILSILAYKSNAPYLDFSDSGLFKVLKLRPQSKLSNLFMRRIDDCENILKYGWFYSLVKAFFYFRKK